MPTGIWCSACGDELGNPEEELHDPNGVLGVIERGIENPEDHHIKAVEIEGKGARMQCSRSGQMTKFTESPPESNSGGKDGGGGSDTPPKGATNDDADTGQKQPSGQSSNVPGGVYEFEEDKQAEDILRKVIDNPAYELNDEQKAEVLSWAEIYDGRIPADMVEEILGNLSGVSKQKSKLMRQKYEALMNKWMQEMSSDQGGPPIGSFTPPTPRPSQSKNTNQKPDREKIEQKKRELRQRRKQQEQQEKQNTGRDVGVGTKEGRRNRQKRREQVVDQFAEEFARNMASDAGRFYSDMRDIMTTLIKRKAEKDPDWFFEKADSFGMDIINELSEPSDAKKEEIRNQDAKSEPDAQIDNAVEQMMQNGEPEQPPQQPPQQPPKQESVEMRTEEPEEPKDRPITEEDNPMKASNTHNLEEGIEGEVSDDEFEDLMGDIAEE